MIKKILVASLLCSILSFPCMAESWQEVKATSNQKAVAKAYIDVDSIHKNSYTAVFRAKYIYRDKHYALATLEMTSAKGIKPLSFIECSPDGYLMRTLSYRGKYLPIGKSSLTKAFYDMIFNSI